MFIPYIYIYIHKTYKYIYIYMCHMSSKYHHNLNDWYLNWLNPINIILYIPILYRHLYMFFPYFPICWTLNTLKCPIPSIISQASQAFQTFRGQLRNHEGHIASEKRRHRGHFNGKSMGKWSVFWGLNNITMENHHLFMGKLTISMAIFNHGY